MISIDYSKVHVLLVGDVMLDRFEYGRVNRISPEAPVPIFIPEQTMEMLGGAANVAANLDELKCKVTLISQIGSDPAGKSLKKALARRNTVFHFINPSGYKTTVKNRLIAGNNHLLRIDREEFRTPSTNEVTDIALLAKAKIPQCDIVLLSDYGKGLLSKELSQSIIAQANRFQKPIVVDPKGTDYEKYTGATLIKPNLKEFSEVTRECFNPQSKYFRKDVVCAARQLMEKYSFEGILLTLSEHGMLYVPVRNSDEVIYLPTQAKEVFDVSGAGDTSLAALGAAIGAGNTIRDAMQVANVAAGIVVSKLGTATVSSEELEATMMGRAAVKCHQKIFSLSEVQKKCEVLKKLGKRIGFTNGCFDCCHLGHLHSLREAKQLCDILVVGVNSDDWIRGHKGANRPIQDEQTRVQLIAALEFVDFVVVFKDETALPLVKKLRPHVIAKEGYAIEQWPEGRFVQSIGGQAVTLNHINGYSTTKILKHMEDLP